MKVNIIQTITKILDEDRNVLSTNTVEGYVLEAAEGKALKNIKTGRIISGQVFVYTRAKIADYIEIIVEE